MSGGSLQIKHSNKSVRLITQFPNHSGDLGFKMEMAFNKKGNHSSYIDNMQAAQDRRHGTIRIVPSKTAAFRQSDKR
jgi:hypothetical protein